MTYTEKEKQQIITLRNNNVSWKIISQTVNKNISSLRHWWVKYQKIKDLPPKPKIDKSKTSGRIGLQIKNITKNNPKITIRDTVVELQKLNPSKTDLPSKSTIHRYLQKNDFKMIQLLKKPLVSTKNQIKRVEFATNQLENLDKLMHETIWSDETTVRKAPKGQDIYFRCHSSVDKENLPLNHQLHSGGFSVMFWGCFSAFGLGPLVALEGNQNQHSYVETLKEYLLPEITAAQREFGINMVFMQDNAPCHKTNLVLNFLQENNISTLDWPPQSPDMNPIENLWSIIKKRRQKKYGFVKTKNELIEQVFKIWNEIDTSLLESLTDSIENRLREVIRLEGRSTKY